MIIVLGNDPVVSIIRKTFGSQNERQCHYETGVRWTTWKNQPNERTLVRLYDMIDHDDVERCGEGWPNKNFGQEHSDDKNAQHLPTDEEFDTVQTLHAT